MNADQVPPAVRRPDQIRGRTLGPGVTATELLNDEHGCRGLHQRRLSLADGAGLTGTAGGQGEAWYVITGTGFLDAERPGRVALAPGTAVWLEAAAGYACQAQAGYEANSKVFQTGANLLDILNKLQA